MQDTAAHNHRTCGMQQQVDRLNSRPLQQIYNLDKKVRAGLASGHLLLEGENLHQVCLAYLRLNKSAVLLGPNTN